MPTDPFALTSDSLTAPALRAFPITTSDTVLLNNVTRAIYVGTGGDIVLRAAGSQADVTLKNIPSGTILPIRTVAVRSTGTTAADVVGLS